jgi:hypothetical protein
MLRFLFQALEDQRLQPGRDGTVVGGGKRHPRYLLVGNIVRRPPGERQHTGEDAIEDYADGVDVGARINIAAHTLLGWHVERRPQGGSAGRDVRILPIHELGDAEIEELGIGRS